MFINLHISLYLLDSLFLCFKTILEVVVPKYLKYLIEATNQKDSFSAAQAEIQAITNIAISIRALINSCETFTR